MKQLFFILIFASSAFAWDGPTVKKKTEMKYFLHTGFIFDAVLETAIFSFNTITPVIALVETDIHYLDKVMIPQGTLIVGDSSVLKTIDRVNVNFWTMVFPNGQEVNLSAIGLHVDGSGGIPGKAGKKKKAAIPAGILLRSAAQTASLAAPSVGTQFMSEIATEAGQELKERDIYSVEVKKGVEIKVYVRSRLEY